MICLYENLSSISELIVAKYISKTVAYLFTLGEELDSSQDKTGSHYRNLKWYQLLLFWLNWKSLQLSSRSPLQRLSVIMMTLLYRTSATFGKDEDLSWDNATCQLIMFLNLELKLNIVVAIQKKSNAIKTFFLVFCYRANCMINVFCKIWFIKRQTLEINRKLTKFMQFLW